MESKISLVDQLIEQEKRFGSTRSGKVAVFSHRKEIEQGLNAGFTLLDIYNLLSDNQEMPITYSSFVKLVRKYIRPISQ